VGGWGVTDPLKRLVAPQNSGRQKDDMTSYVRSATVRNSVAQATCRSGIIPPPPRISLPESRDKKPLAQTDRTVDYHGVQISPYEPLEARISGTGVWKPRIPLLWNRMRSHWIMFPTFRHDAVLTLKRRNINTLQESNRCFVDYAKDTKTLCGQRSSTCCLQQ